MPKQNRSKALENERLTMEAFQALERLRLVALWSDFSGDVAVRLVVVDGVIQSVEEHLNRSIP